MSDEEDIKKAKDLVKVGLEHLKKVGAWNPGDFELSGTSQPNLATKHKQEDQAVSLFERSTPAERLRLYQEDPEAWQAMMDAHEQAGLRKLFGSPGNTRY